MQSALTVQGNSIDFGRHGGLIDCDDTKEWL